MDRLVAAAIDQMNRNGNACGGKEPEHDGVEEKHG
jgi:hypothetical protein